MNTAVRRLFPVAHITLPAEAYIAILQAQLNASLLQISVLAMLIPAGFHFAYSSTSSTSSVILTEEEEKADVLKMSRGVAVILLVIYLAYLVFQMWSHADLVRRSCLFYALVSPSPDDRLSFAAV